MKFKTLFFLILVLPQLNLFAQDEAENKK